MKKKNKIISLAVSVFIFSTMSLPLSAAYYEGSGKKELKINSRTHSSDWAKQMERDVRGFAGALKNQLRRVHTDQLRKCAKTALMMLAIKEGSIEIGSQINELLEAGGPDIINETGYNCGYNSVAAAAIMGETETAIKLLRYRSRKLTTVQDYSDVYTNILFLEEFVYSENLFHKKGLPLLLEGEKTNFFKSFVPFIQNIKDGEVGLLVSKPKLQLAVDHGFDFVNKDGYTPNREVLKEFNFYNSVVRGIKEDCGDLNPELLAKKIEKLEKKEVQEIRGEAFRGGMFFKEEYDRAILAYCNKELSDEK